MVSMWGVCKMTNYYDNTNEFFGAHIDAIDGTICDVSLMTSRMKKRLFSLWSERDQKLREHNSVRSAHITIGQELLEMLIHMNLFSKQEKQRILNEICPGIMGTFFVQRINYLNRPEMKFMEGELDA